MICFNLVLRSTLAEYADGALQTEAVIEGTEVYIVPETVSEALVDDSDSGATDAETLVPSENTASGTYNSVMLVLSVVQLFVLLVIAFFTIVRRFNND